MINFTRICYAKCFNFCSSFNLIQLFLAICSLLVLLCSLYLQYLKHIEPCILCIMQRSVVIILFIFTFTGYWIKNPTLQKIFIVSELIFAVSGLYFAGRQIWLQNLSTDSLPACLPSFDILINYFPWKDIISALFFGSGDCSKIGWQSLGLSLSQWSAAFFVFVFFFLLFYMLIRK